LRVAGESRSQALGSYLSYLNANRRLGTFRRYARVLKTFRNCFLAQYHPEIEPIEAGRSQRYGVRRP